MGGKTWSEQEEEYFWEVLVPSSPKAVKKPDRSYSWAKCACMMQQAMGKNARRKYTTLMLFEHYFQNVNTGHTSPCAGKFVKEHLRQLKLENGRLDPELPAGPGIRRKGKVVLRSVKPKPSMNSKL